MAQKEQSGVLLRGHMVRRLPTKHQLNARRPMVLTDRDRSILCAIYDHGCLDMGAIQIAFFPAEDRSSHCSAAYDRVRQLWLWNFTDRVELPVAPTLGGRRPYLYALGARGIPVVANAEGRGRQAVSRRRLDRLDDLDVEHDLKASLFWARLKAELSETRITRWHWVPERDLRAERRRVCVRPGDRWLPVLPDGEFWIHYPEGRVQCGMVEIDMGSLTLSRFGDKVRAFAQWIDSRATHARLNNEASVTYEVYVVTYSDGRRKQLVEAAKKALIGAACTPEIYLATFEVLDEPETFTCWRSLDGEECQLLYEDAYEAPSPTETADSDPSAVDDLQLRQGA